MSTHHDDDHLPEETQGYKLSQPKQSLAEYAQMGMSTLYISVVLDERVYHFHVPVRSGMVTIGTYSTDRLPCYSKLDYTASAPLEVYMLCSEATTQSGSARGHIQRTQTFGDSSSGTPACPFFCRQETPPTLLLSP